MVALFTVRSNFTFNTIIGVYLEGARWNTTTHMLDDSKPK